MDEVTSAICGFFLSGKKLLNSVIFAGDDLQLYTVFLPVCFYYVNFYSHTRYKLLCSYKVTYFILFSKNELFYYLLGITLIFFSLHSYDSLCQRGSELMLVIRLIQLYWKLSLNLQILLDV